jgi:hypothetical protein
MATRSLAPAPDTLTGEGAAALKHQIEMYWRDRGFSDVKCSIENSAAGYILKSNMKNGWPPSCHP